MTCNSSKCIAMTKPFIYWVRFATMVTVSTFGAIHPAMATGPSSERRPPRAAVRPSLACQEALLQGCVALMVATCWSEPQRLEAWHSASRPWQDDDAVATVAGVADAHSIADAHDPLERSLTWIAVNTWTGTGISSIASRSAMVHTEFRIRVPSPRSILQSVADFSEAKHSDLHTAMEPSDLDALNGDATHRASEHSVHSASFPQPEATGQPEANVQQKSLENQERQITEHSIAASDGELWQVSKIPCVEPPEFHDAYAQGMAPNVDWLFGTPPATAEASNSDIDPGRPHESSGISNSLESRVTTSSEAQGGLESEWGNRVFRGAEYREWIDNTGTYRVQARVAVIFEDRVRLLKDTGKITTVPITRLSSRDRAYILWVAASLSERARGSLQR